MQEEREDGEGRREKMEGEGREVVVVALALAGCWVG